MRIGSIIPFSYEFQYKCSLFTNHLKLSFVHHHFKCGWVTGGHGNTLGGSIYNAVIGVRWEFFNYTFGQKMPIN